MEVRAIRSKAYRAMLAEVSTLVDLDPNPDSPEGERLEVHSTLVEAYGAAYSSLVGRPEAVDA